MKKRSVGLVIVLSIITLGIYTLFWLFDTKEEMNARGAKIPPLKLLFLPLLGLAAIILLELIANGVDGQESSRKSFNIMAALVGVFSIGAMLIIPLYWYYKYCRGIELATRGQTTFGTSYLLWIVLSFVGVGFVWPGIIQSGFNTADSVGPANPNYPPSPYNNPPQSPYDAGSPDPYTGQPQIPQTRSYANPSQSPYPGAPQPQYPDTSNLPQPPQYPPNNTPHPF
ncbi:MAG TPA: DUF4234 domain-containing protein [Candidatus Saccharimonadales bacterium]|nr:DUF4234 domain-containing protein [Candidatus Saccharimonadales bacterium]